MAMLSHPNIVSVYDVSKGDDLDYIVMELIDGITLKQYMQKKQGRLNWRESLYFITQIVRALGHAHSRGSSTGTSSPTTLWSSGTAV